MTCPVKTVVINDLIYEKGVISKTREILDYDKFDKLNALFTQHAVEKYGLPAGNNLLFTVDPVKVTKERGNRLRTGERTFYRANPNTKLFNLLNEIIEDYNKRYGIENSIATKEVENIFNTTSLSKIGSIEQYAEYLKTIFPDSKVNEVVYHGTAAPENIEDFNLRNNRTYFSTNDTASQYAAWDEHNRINDDNNAKTNPRIIPALVNITNPKRLDHVEFKETEKEYADNDGVYSTNTIDPLGGKELQIAVFDSSNIHILGSKQDIEGFKDFVQGKQSQNPNNVNYQLKAVDILSSDKAKQVFEKGEKNNWDLNKILTELQVPKAQKQIILDKGISNREEIITSLLADNSFTIEINTARQKEGLVKDGTEFKIGEDYYYSDPIRNVYKIMYSVDNGGGSKDITKQEFEEARQNSKPTQHYSNLTVPGGTNYTENEIATPAITPSIKGHAQFATDNGIGWFRSDDKALGGEYSREESRDFEEDDFDPEFGFIGNPTEILHGNTKTIKEGTPTKTRRILELQSDLFQKGRDKKDLIGKIDTINPEGVSASISKETTNENQFLQLLNKKNNWVTFFVKSIIQDSVKKGYEKVLFPKGDTAAKIEGHQTLEEFKKQKEDRIKELEDKLNNQRELEAEVMQDMMEAQRDEYLEINADEQLQGIIYSTKQEIKILKQELADVESGQTQLSSIANFYENTVTNILKKQGYNPVEITDEYGNTWNEIDLSTVKNDKIILQTKYVNDLLDENKDDILYELDSNDFDNNNNDNSTENLNNFILFNNQKGSFTAPEVLDNIVSNFDKLSKGSIQIIDKLLPMLSKTNAKIKFVKTSDLSNSDTLMEYDHQSNEIRISRERLEQVSEGHAVRGFLHEVVHSITVQAYSKPQSIQEQMFKEFIDEMYSKYKELSGYVEGNPITNKTYGFNNALEFIAEIMTNPEFQSEFKRLENNNNKPSGLWNKLIDYIRSLIGLRKSSEFESIIDSITTIAMQSDYIGGNTFNNPIFETKITEDETSTEEKGSILYKLKSMEDKLNRLRDAFLDTYEYNISNYERIIKTIKDPTKLQAFNNKQKEVLNELTSLKDTEHWKAVTIYVTNLSSNIKALQASFTKEDLNQEDLAKTVNLYKKYLSTNALIKDIQRVIADAEYETDIPITKEELSVLEQAITEANSNKILLENKFIAFSKRAAMQILNTRENSRDVMHKWRKRLKKEHKDAGIVENFESWFIKQIDGRYKDELDKDIYEKAYSIVNDTGFDISTATMLGNSALNTNSDLIQILNNIIVTMRNAIVERKRTAAIELQTLHNEFINQMGNRKPSELYKHMYEKTKDGETILKGEYTIKFKEAYEKVRDAHYEKLEELLKNNDEHSKIVSDFKKNSEFTKWKKENLKTIQNEDGSEYTVPSDKWKSDTSGMSEIELKVLKRARLALRRSNKQTYGIQSLVSKPIHTAIFYKLPTVSKTKLEHLLEGNFKGATKDFIKDNTAIRPDDIGYEEVRTDTENRPVLNVRVHYRGKLEEGQQSLDLFTLMAAETYNGISFEEKHKAESESDIILDVAKDKNFYNTSGVARIPLLGKYMNRNKAVKTSGEQTNTYKRLQSMIESNIYDIMHKNIGTIGKVDLNKVIGMVNGWTGMVGMSLNEVSAAVNVMNGKAQIFLETIAGNYMTSKSIAKSEGIYFKDLKETLADVNRPVSMSFTNQVNTMFDTFGSVSPGVEQAFIKNTMMKTNLDLQSLQFMQNSGEHWMQSVLTMGVLDSIQVMNAKGEFLNKEGKVVKDKKDAATVLDMLKLNKDGKLEMDKSVVYTSHTLGVPYDKGGKEMLMKLVKKKVFDTAGNYDINTQPEAMRHAYGKIFGMYRKYLVPMGVARFRGMIHVDKSIDELDSHQIFFSEALQDYETGTYTELTRLLVTGVYPALKSLNYELLSNNWNELSDTQKKQIHKAVVEIIITGVILPIMGTLLAMMGSEGADDDDFIWYALLVTRRLESELSSYRDLREQYRILESPIPSMHIVRNAMGVIFQVFSPSEWDDRYESGNNKDKLKIGVRFSKLIPIWKRFFTTYRDGHKFIEGQTQ